MDSKDYLHTLFSCEGRQAIVTGASSGLGAEMARVLVSAGADVLAAVTDITLNPNPEARVRAWLEATRPAS